MKRGSIELSFGVIFSIILIIAIIGIAGYVIVKFMGLSSCTKLGLFYQDLDDSVQKAYRSYSLKQDFTASLPGGIEQVCIGNLSNAGSTGIEREIKERYRFKDANVFLYPIDTAEKICDSNAYSSIKHIDDSSFVCIPVVDGKITIRVEKDGSDALVTLGR